MKKIISFVKKYKVSIAACVLVAVLGIGVYFAMGQPATTSIGSNIHTTGNLTVDGTMNVPRSPDYPVVGAYATANFTSGTTYKWNNVFINNGNHYNPITGEITAPYNGAYKFCASIRTSTLNNTISARLLLNGVGLFDGNQRAWYASADLRYVNLSDCITLYMETGDILTFVADTNTHQCEHGRCKMSWHLIARF